MILQTYIEYVNIMLSACNGTFNLMEYFLWFETFLLFIRFCTMKIVICPVMVKTSRAESASRTSYWLDVFLSVTFLNLDHLSLINKVHHLIQQQQSLNYLILSGILQWYPYMEEWYANIQCRFSHFLLWYLTHKLNMQLNHARLRKTLLHENHISVLPVSPVLTLRIHLPIKSLSVVDMLLSCGKSPWV